MTKQLNASLLIKYFVLGVLLCIGLFKVYESSWATVFIVFQAFLFSLVPTLIRKLYGIRTPHLLQAGVAIFMFATIFLGESAGFYERFWWWDLLWHTLAGFGFGLIAYMVLIIVYRRQNVALAPLFTSLFAVTFSLGMSALWEILEFLIDLTLGTTMQPSGHDTMTDLIVGLFGALASVIAGYRYLYSQEAAGICEIIHEGVEKNDPLLTH